MRISCYVSFRVGPHQNGRDRERVNRDVAILRERNERKSVLGQCETKRTSQAHGAEMLVLAVGHLTLAAQDFRLTERPIRVDVVGVSQ